MRFLLAYPIAILCLSGTAHATANVGCSAKDQTLVFSVDALESRGAGYALTDLKAEAELLAKQVPEEFRKVTFAPEELVERWMTGADFRMHFHRETEAKDRFVSYDLVIVTTEDPESEGFGYKGTYALTFTASAEGSGEPVELTSEGEATCYGG